jgi:hypothetical protein
MIIPLIVCHCTNIGHQHLRTSLATAAMFAALLVSATAWSDQIKEPFTISAFSAGPGAGIDTGTSMFAQFNPAQGRLDSVDSTVNGPATWSSNSMNTLVATLLTFPAGFPIAPSQMFASQGAIDINIVGTNNKNDLISFIGNKPILLNLEFTLKQPGPVFQLSTTGLAGDITYNFTPPVSFVISGGPRPPIPFQVAPGSLVICEGNISGGQCDGAGVSDVLTFGSPTTYMSDPAGNDADPETMPADADVLGTLPLPDVEGAEHTVEAILAMGVPYIAASREMPGFDLTDNLPVDYFFADSALVDNVPEPPSVLLLGAGLLAFGAALCWRRSWSPHLTQSGRPTA